MLVPCIREVMSAGLCRLWIEEEKRFFLERVAYTPVSAGGWGSAVGVMGLVSGLFRFSFDLFLLEL